MVASKLQQNSIRRDQSIDPPLGQKIPLARGRNPLMKCQLWGRFLNGLCVWIRIVFGRGLWSKEVLELCDGIGIGRKTRVCWEEQNGALFQVQETQKYVAPLL